MQVKAPGQIHPTAVLCVDAYTSGVLQGRLYDPASTRTYHINSLFQFLITMDHILDATSGPQSFHRVRTFPGTDARPRQPVLSGRITPGVLATFPIQILFRQNSSWQGSVGWLEDETQQQFRSALELLFLIDNVLGHAIKNNVG